MASAFLSKHHATGFAIRLALSRISRTSKQAARSMISGTQPRQRSSFVDASALLSFCTCKCTRLWGHAGTDVETTYRKVEEIEAAEANDPVLVNARRLVETGAATPDELRRMIEIVQSSIECGNRRASSTETSDCRRSHPTAGALR